MSGMDVKHPPKTIELTIDGRPVAAKEGEKLMPVAERSGVEIPHFCYHERLSIAGNCRMCLVKVEGAPKLMPACNVTVAANMKIETRSEEVRRARRNVLQFLMLNHPVDCGICDKAGECRLQNYQFEYGPPRSNSIEPKHHKRKLYALSSRLQLDNERCILCSRCVRFTKEVSKSHMLGIVERGGHAYVERLNPEFGEDPYSDNVVNLCPTGALLSRDFLYASRVWFLEPVRSVCTGCSRGCNVDVWRRKKQWRLRSLDPALNEKIYRVTAHDNPEVNGPWLCNNGFDLHTRLTSDRALTPMIGGAEASVDAALEKIKGLLDAARSPAMLVSAHASNEELDAFAQTLAPRMAVYVRRDHTPAPGEIVEDDFLIKSDKNPNIAGVQQRFGARQLATEQIAQHDLFIVWGDFPDFGVFGDAPVVHFASFMYRGERAADVLIPTSTTLERCGSFTNFAGVVNRFEQALEKPPLVQHATEMFVRLAE